MKRMMLAALMLPLVAGVVAADESLPESRGRKVRVQTASGPIQGRLAAFDDATVWVQPHNRDAARIAIARAAIERMEVRRGKGWHVAYVSMGAGAGLLTGAFLSMGDCFDDCPSRGKELGLLFGPAVLGGVVAGLATLHIWEDVEVGRVKAEVRPVPRGATFQVAIRF